MIYVSVQENYLEEMLFKISGQSITLIYYLNFIVIKYYPSFTPSLSSFKSIPSTLHYLPYHQVL